jgi:hypothetical protein
VVDTRIAYRILGGKPLRKRQLRRLIRRSVDNIKMDLREVDCDDERRMELAQDHVQWQALC